MLGKFGILVAILALVLLFYIVISCGSRLDIGTVSLSHKSFTPLYKSIIKYIYH